MVRYVKYLPEEPLPTFWTIEELELLRGTSLEYAIRAKLKSLRKEYDELRKSTKGIPWCSSNWWNDGPNGVSFDDWKQVDAMYRSRALEFPGVGDCMVPVIDMANHAGDSMTTCVYQRDQTGNALLIERPEKELSKGDELNISWADIVNDVMRCGLHLRQVR